MDKYTAYHHLITGRKFYIKFRQNDPPMKPNKVNGLRPDFKLWISHNDNFWDIVTGLKISNQLPNCPDWSGDFSINDRTTSEPITHLTQFYMKHWDIPKYIEVPSNGALPEAVDCKEPADVNDVPIVFAFVYGDNYVISTKRFESMGEKFQVLKRNDEKGKNESRDEFMAHNVDYIVFWRQEDADFIHEIRIELPMIDFSVLSHLLLGGFQNLSEKEMFLQPKLDALEIKKQEEWDSYQKQCELNGTKKRSSKEERMTYPRKADGTVDLSGNPEEVSMCFILEAFFYENYALIMQLSQDSLSNLDELTEHDIGSKMLQTIFPLFSLHPEYKYVHHNGPGFGPLTIVKSSGMNMFRLGSVFFKNRRGEFSIGEVERKFGPYQNHHILTSAIVDIDMNPIGTDECIANGILFSRNPYPGHYATFNNLKCDGIVIGRSTHITLDCKYKVLTRDTNIHSHIPVFMTLSYIFDGAGEHYAHNATMTAFEGVSKSDLKMVEFPV